MPRVRFEHTIPVSERAKTVHALDRVATVIGLKGMPPARGVPKRSRVQLLSTPNLA
jgi:hypothetical protein